MKNIKSYTDQDLIALLEKDYPSDSRPLILNYKWSGYEVELGKHIFAVVLDDLVGSGGFFTTLLYVYINQDGDLTSDFREHPLYHGKSLKEANNKFIWFTA